MLKNKVFYRGTSRKRIHFAKKSRNKQRMYWSFSGENAYIYQLVTHSKHWWQSLLRGTSAVHGQRLNRIHLWSRVKVGTVRKNSHNHEQTVCSHCSMYQAPQEYNSRLQADCCWSRNEVRNIQGKFKLSQTKVMRNKTVLRELNQNKAPYWQNLI